jgi:competence protein ComEC
MVAITLAALALVTALLWSPVVPASGGAAAVGLGAACLAAAGAGRRRLALRVALAGLPATLAMGVAGHLVASRWADGVPSGVTVTGSVCEFPRAQPGAWRFVLDVDEGGSAPVPRRILVNWYDGPARPTVPPAPGERWRLDLRLKAPRGLSNPDTFDYERWLFAAGIGATGSVRPAAVNGRVAGAARGCPAASWRAGAARRISAVLAGRESAPYVLGLAIGAYQALPEPEWDRLRRTGTVHLISISGFHIALVAAPAALAGAALGWLALGAGRQCRPRAVGAWTAAAAAAGYGLLAGFTVPTARSVVAVLLVALLATSRRVVTVPELLAAVAFVVLLVEPLAPLAPGFWLSFAGVVVLAGLAAGWRPRAGPAGAVGGLVRTQLAMTVGLTPLVAGFFGQVPVSGLVANLVAVPAFSAVLLPVTLLGAALVGIAPEAGGWLLHRAADGFDLWRTFVAWCAGWPGGVWLLPGAPAAAQLVAGLGAVLVLWPRPAPGRWLGLAMLAGLWGPAESPVAAGQFRVTVLDVGQGLAVLVQTARHTLLYDAGPAYRASDAGERVVVPVLQAFGVRRIDTLILSHADADHRGGAASVLERYPASVVRGAPPGPSGPPPSGCRAGLAWQWDGVYFEVLHPPPGRLPARDNAQSCVVRVSAGAARLLLTGDIEAAEEAVLAAARGFGPVDLMLAPHHGSRSSSTAPFVAATRPRFLVVSAGHRNRWGFPAGDVVARWRAAGACVLTTAEEGAIRFDTGPWPGLRWRRSERRAAPGIWLARPPAARCA